MEIINTLLEITAYSGVIFTVTMLAKKCFAKKMSPRLHYAVWLLLIVRLLMPVTLASPVHLFVIPATAQYEADEKQIQPQTSFSAALEVNTNYSPDTNTSAADTADQTAEPAFKTVWPVPKTLSLQDNLLIIWIFGASAGLIYLLCRYFAISRKIRKNAGRPSKRLLELFEEVKDELGVKSRVKLVCQYQYGTPALIFPRTVLMPVEALVVMDDEHVKYALRHELVHYRHGDHIAVLLLSLLNAIYWFNPFVWFAVFRISADMETACDSAVARGLDDAGRNAYAGLVIDLFSRPAQRQIVLGLAGKNTKRAAERRIRGIFMNGRSRKSVQIACSVLAVLLLATCFTTACRPAAVNSAAPGEAMKKILVKAGSFQDMKGSLKARLDAPDRFQIDFQDGKIKTAANADIVLPEVDKIPVVRVEGQAFDRQTVLKIKSILMDNSKFYDPEELSRETKAELTAILEKLKQRRTELKAQGMAPLQPELDNALPGTSPEVASDNSPLNGEASMAAYNSLDQVNESIIFIQNRLPAAPNERVLKEVAGELQEEPAPSDASEEVKKEHQENPLEYLNASQLNPNGGMRTMEVFINGRESTFEYINRKDYEPSGGFYSTQDEWDESRDLMGTSEKAALDKMQFPTMTMDQAQETADRFLKQTGIDYLYCERRDKVIGGSGQSWGDDTIRRGNLLKAYRLEYVRKVNGVPLTVTDTEQAMGFDDPERFLGWTYERMTFVIDDSGITELKWYAPYKILNTAAVNVSLIPFPQIAEIFKQKIVSKNEGMDIAGMEIKVAEVRLGLMRVIEKGSVGQGFLIPVWDFFGSFTQQVTDDKGNAIKEHFNGLSNLLTINAIDGSVIDRNSGTIG